MCQVRSLLKSTESNRNEEKLFQGIYFYLLMKIASLSCSFLFWPLTFH